MGLKSLLAKPLAAFTNGRIDRWRNDPLRAQEKVFQQLLAGGRITRFGKDHRLDQVGDYAAFKQAVPIKDYEGLRGYVESIIAGETDVLWPGKPAYFAKTSGTTSGSKFIPITKDSIPNHIGTARNALLQYIHNSGNSAFSDRKMIFLQGSPKLDETGGIPTGRLSGMVYNHVPGYLMRNRMPSYATNCIEDWETKLDAICQETVSQRMSLISGIPPWVVMYFERLLEISGKETIGELFPDFSLFVYGGVNYKPYKARIDELIGRRIDTVETYPASEGFIAFQDQLDSEELLLNVASGIFFEFVPANEIHDENPTRLTLGEVKTGENYAIIINNNAGLWGYLIGDTVRFTSTQPYRLVVSGRIKHFISAFGEHVIAEEVEGAMSLAVEKLKLDVREFTVAPNMGGDEVLPCHEWVVEFGTQPGTLKEMSKLIDEELQRRNSYYRDLIQGSILRPLQITPVRPDAFKDYLRSKGKLGGQNKVARLANDRAIADELVKFQL